MLSESCIRSYKLMRRLGKGGCVRIVMAQRRSTGQTVAVKTIHARRRTRCPDIGELLREACFLAGWLRAAGTPASSDSRHGLSRA
jgi:hypothetical protein